mgnify:CR=1 FL=1
MKVLFVNTSERIGGAAIACNRLMKAMRKHGIVTTMLVRDRQTDDADVMSLTKSFILKVKFVYERLVIFLNNGFDRDSVFQVDIANTGSDITKYKSFIEADVIHLHWVNQAFLSLDDLEKILSSGKRIVVTMHDQWYFTGVCHYSGGCEKYKTECYDCELIRGLFSDIVSSVFDRKKKIYDKADVTFVSCSRWLADVARRSKLLENHDVTSVPNAIDTDFFMPMDKSEARRKWGLPQDKRLMLFGSQKITDERKGFRYLVEACRLLKQRNGELAYRIGVVVLGGKSDVVKSMLPFDVYPIDYVSDQSKIVELYNSVDVYVTPSLQDNLPNTIAEAMSCGVPCVGFDVGGIPEMIDHEKNGYVSNYQDSDDLSRGIEWVLESDDYDNISVNCRKKALDTYSESAVVEQYLKVYDNNHNGNV